MRNIFILLCVVLFSSCGKYYGHLIESDYSFDGNFGNYHSYNFIADKNFEGSELHQELIEKYLGQSLDKWGYEQKAKKPSLLIFYKLYYEDFEMKGYNQPNFEAWVQENFSTKLIGKASSGEASADSTITAFDPTSEGGVAKTVGYDPRLCELREGTLLISFYDRKKKKTVWQGYASGIFGNDRFDNNRFVRHIVYRIMDKYRVLADKSLTSSLHRTGQSIIRW